MSNQAGSSQQSGQPQWESPVKPTEPVTQPLKLIGPQPISPFFQLILDRGEDYLSTFFDYFDTKSVLNIMCSFEDLVFGQRPPIPNLILMEKEARARDSTRREQPTALGLLAKSPTVINCEPGFVLRLISYYLEVYPDNEPSNVFSDPEPILAPYRQTQNPVLRLSHSALKGQHSVSRALLCDTGTNPDYLSPEYSFSPLDYAIRYAYFTYRGPQQHKTIEHIETAIQLVAYNANITNIAESTISCTHHLLYNLVCHNGPLYQYLQAPASNTPKLIKRNVYFNIAIPPGINGQTQFLKGPVPPEHSLERALMALLLIINGEKRYPGWRM